MSTLLTRIGVSNVPNFIPDNTGVTIDQHIYSLTASSGTVTIVPQAQYEYVYFQNVLTGNVTIQVSTASQYGYSTLPYNGTNQVNANADLVCPQICDIINIIAIGPASGTTYSITLATASFGVTNTITNVGGSQGYSYVGTYNGINYIGAVNVK